MIPRTDLCTDKKCCEGRDNQEVNIPITNQNYVNMVTRTRSSYKGGV